MGQENAELRGRLTLEAENEIVRQCKPTIDEYKTDREIQQLRDQALLRDQQQTARIMELLKFDSTTGCRNDNLQQMLESTRRIPANVHPVQSAIAVSDALNLQTPKAAPPAACCNTTHSEHQPRDAQLDWFGNQSDNSVWSHYWKAKTGQQADDGNSSWILENQALQLRRALSQLVTFHKVAFTMTSICTFKHVRHT